MDVKNVLYGAHIERNGVDITGQVAEIMKRELVQAGVTIGLFDVVSVKSAVLKAVESNKYDVLICQEELSGDKLGGGSISEWKNINPNIQIIFLIDVKKKSGKKLENLYEKNGYYDALYENELSGVNLAKLINTPRTKDEAFVYYGLDRLEEKGMEPAKEMVNKEEVKAASDTPAPFKEQEVAEPVEEKVPFKIVEESNVNKTSFENANSEQGDMDDELGKKLRDMERFFDEMPPKGEEGEIEAVEEPAIEGVVEEPVFGESLFGNSSMFKNTAANIMPEDEETGAEIIAEVEAENATFTMEAPAEEVVEIKNVEGVSSYYNSGSFSSEEKEPIFREHESVVVGNELAVASAQRVKPVGDKIHVKGVISDVMSEDLVMVVLEKPLVFENGESIDDYSVTLLVQTGSKGHMENGKYRTSILRFTGYGNCMIDEYTAIMEVLDTNLLSMEERISAKDCNMIFVKQ